MENRKKYFTIKKLKVFKLLYANTSQKKLAEKLLLKKWQPSEMARTLGLKKCKEYKTLNHFKKGIKPHNTGKKIPPEVKAKMLNTMFKKGHITYNKLWDGMVTTRKKGGKQYQWTRVNGIWQPYNVWLWKNAGREIPHGYCLTYIDGNQLNCTLDNIKLITKKQLAIDNSGSTRLTDRYVANCLSRETSKKEQYLKFPELIELKRELIINNRILKDEHFRTIEES